MKKVITLCLFAFIMVLGTESVTAQSTTTTTEINAKAASKTKALSKYLKISKDQSQQMYKAFQVFGKQNATLTNAPLSKEKSLKAANALDDKIKEILSREQYELYKEQTNR